MDRGSAAYAIRAAGPAVAGEPEEVVAARDRGFSYSHGEVDPDAYGGAAWIPVDPGGPQAAVRRATRIDPTFPRITPHDLRHTAASLAISAGANVKAVQRMLGHASAAMTLDTYADLFDDDLDQVAQALTTARHAAVVVVRENPQPACVPAAVQFKVRCLGTHRPGRRRVPSDGHRSRHSPVAFRETGFTRFLPTAPFPAKRMPRDPSVSKGSRGFDDGGDGGI